MSRLSYAVTAPPKMLARLVMCSLLALSLSACVSVPPQVADELAPPGDTAPDHFRLLEPADD